MFGSIEHYQTEYRKYSTHGEYCDDIDSNSPTYEDLQLEGYKINMDQLPVACKFGNNIIVSIDMQLKCCEDYGYILLVNFNGTIKEISIKDANMRFINRKINKTTCNEFIFKNNIRDYIIQNRKIDIENYTKLTSVDIYFENRELKIHEDLPNDIKKYMNSFNLDEILILVLYCSYNDFCCCHSHDILIERNGNEYNSEL
jgi:hypothetical protein